MRNKNYTIIIAPSDLKPARMVTLHQSTVVLVLLTLLVLMPCGILGSYKYLEHTTLDRQYKEAVKEMGELREANRVLIRSREKEIRVREFLGLEHAGGSSAQPGQGGPGPGYLMANESDIPSRQEVEVLAERQPMSHKQLSPAEEALVLEKDLEELLEFLEEQQGQLATIPTISPIDFSGTWISSLYGYRKSPFTGRREFHSGLDLSAKRGTPVLATGDGRVSFAGGMGLLGTTVKIRHDVHYETIYGHLLRSNVKLSQRVKRGDIIGFVGVSGRSTGYHLHYEVIKDGKAANPSVYLLNWREENILAEHRAEGKDHYYR